jgi:hypothetical protein
MNRPVGQSNTYPSRVALPNVMSLNDVACITDQVESISTPPGNNARFKRRVRFANCNVIHPNRSLGAYTDYEREACWYQEREYYIFQTESKVAAHIQRQIRRHQFQCAIEGEVTSSKTCYGVPPPYFQGVGVVDDPNRGLELEIDRERISMRVGLSIRAVLIEQEIVRLQQQGRGWTTKKRMTGHESGNFVDGIVNVAEDRLRWVYQEFSDLALQEARIYAVMDQIAVKFDGVETLMGKCG